MDLLSLLFSPESVAWSVFVIMVVAAAGLALGNIKIAGINLGIAGVLFSGILSGHIGLSIDHVTLEFLRDFGLILFVYSIGTQVGPGFFSSFKKQGLQLNLLAAGVVLGGIAVTLAVARLAGFDIPTAVGMYSGAVTNTPSLAAAQQALAAIDPEAANAASVGYALAYPGAIMGIILTASWAWRTTTRCCAPATLCWRWAWRRASGNSRWWWAPAAARTSRSCPAASCIRAWS
jgi:putative transport protein